MVTTKKISLKNIQKSKWEGNKNVQSASLIIKEIYIPYIFQHIYLAMIIKK